MSKTISFDNPSHAINGPKIGLHPLGLYILFFTELWERFSFYGMRAILVLFIVATANEGGLGWTNKEALALYGWYTMLVYVMSIPGGYVADRLLGQKKAVMLGGLLLVIGHSTLAVPQLWAFYTGIVFIILGVGCLKPNISTMVGGLYRPGDGLRDKGFTIFYIGINIGAAAASIIVASVAQKFGWHYGFGLAGIGMFIAQMIYIYGQKYLTGVGDLIKVDKTDTSHHKNIPLTRIEKDRIIVLLISFLIIIVFWAAFEQAGGLMNLYAEQKVNRMLGGFEIPSGWFQSANPIFIILLGGIVASFWYKWQQKGKEHSAIFKMAVGTMIMGSGFFFMTAAAMQTLSSPDGKAAMYWLILAYFLHTVGELCTSPVALSFITKLAPAKYASIMMGLYFASSGLGDKAAGLLGELAQDLGELEVFTGIAVFSIFFGLLLLVFLKKLKTLTHGAEDFDIEAQEMDKNGAPDPETGTAKI